MRTRSRAWRTVRVLTFAIVIALAIAGAGCKKKKPNVPPPVLPPTLKAPEPELSHAPTSIEETAPTTPPPTPPPTTTTKPKTRTRSRASKKTVQPPPVAPPVQTQPGTQATAPTTQPKPETPPQDSVSISASASSDGAAQKRAATEQLLQQTETNLRKLNRQLTDSEESIVRQVRNYITQSRLATQDGDVERANNLALKANLLSQEIGK